MKMIHPDVEAIADVVDTTVFNAAWAPRGWVLLAEPEAYASEILGKPVKVLDGLKVDELKLLVSARGLEYPATTAKKADVTKLFLGTFGEPVAALAADTEVFAPAGSPATTSSAPADNTDKDK